MFKADRIGLVIVLASLAAIAIVATMVFRQQYADRLNDIRSQGVSLVRVISGVPYDELNPGTAQQSLAQILRHSAGDDDFAYLSVVDDQGQTINESTLDGIIVPPASLPAEPSSWLGETYRRLPNDRREIIEFHAPILDDGELRGFVRLGFLRPTGGIDFRQLPFLATVALPVFLLVPLFYLLLRLEVRPIRVANREMGRLVESEGEGFRRIEVRANGELGDFMQRFNQFVEFAGSRISNLEQDQNRLITSTKLLEYKKNRVETVLETLPEAVLILDESGTVTFANQKVAALFDVSQKTILTQAPQKWCNNPDVMLLLSKYQTGNSGPKFTDTMRFNLNTANERTIATRTYPLFSPTKPSAAIGTLVIFRDETQEALARQARADFVSNLSHELKSPLNVLSLYSESLLSESGKSEEFRIEAANVISEEVDRLNKLVIGLLNMTQIENGSLTPDRQLVKLREVAEAAFVEAKNSATDKDTEFVFDAPKEINPVYLDKDLIRIAITNLLSNAVKYNRPGGRVHLKIEETEDAIQIRVADTGIGISEDEQAKIFDKFYRSTDEQVQAIGGHGLGLALTKQIVELHHGSLSLNHEYADGAEFIINLWKETTAVKQAI